MSRGKSFWCKIWHQQIFEEVCINRYKKGLKKCCDCEKGKALIKGYVESLNEQLATDTRR